MAAHATVIVLWLNSVLLLHLLLIILFFALSLLNALLLTAYCSLLPCSHTPSGYQNKSPRAHCRISPARPGDWELGRCVQSSRRLVQFHSLTKPCRARAFCRQPDSRPRVSSGTTYPVSRQKES